MFNTITGLIIFLVVLNNNRNANLILIKPNETKIPILTYLCPKKKLKKSSIHFNA